MTERLGRPAAVWACPDAAALSATFQERLQVALSGRSDLAPILVVAPTVRLLARLQLVAARGIGAAAGVSFLTYDRLASWVLSGAGVVAPPILSTVGLEALCLAEAARSGGALGAMATSFDAGPKVLAAALRDLRESEVSPEDLSAVGAVELADVFERASRHLDGTMGADRTRRQRDATQVVGGSGAFGAVCLLHVGAYDVLPATRMLLAAFARECPVEHLILGLSRGPAFAWAWSRAARVAPLPASSPGVGTGMLGSVLEALFGGGSGGAEPVPAPGDVSRAARVTIVAAPSIPGELEHAARLLLGWHVDEGIALEEMAILARSLDAHGPHLASVLRTYRLPFTSSAELLLLASPGARAVLDLVETLTLDLPRPALIRLLRSPYLRAGAIGVPVEVFSPDRLDLLSRRAGVRQGLAAWTQRPAAHVAGVAATMEGGVHGALHAQDAATLATIAKTLADAGAAFPERRGSWRGIASWLVEVVERLLGREGAAEPAIEEARRRLAQLADLDGSLPMPDAPRGIAEAARQALARGRLPLERRDRGGVRVLDMMQARGLGFRRAVIVGLHAGAMPRPAEPDAVLTDALRRRLGARGIELAPKAGLDDEERLLFGLALGSIAERVVLSWPRSGEGRRRLAPSPFLEELRRTLAGAGVPAAELVLSGHPAFGVTGAASLGLPIRPASALACAGMMATGRGTSAVRELASSHLGERERAALSASLDHVDVTSTGASAEEASLRFDGWIGPIGSAPTSLTVSAIERLACCPLQYLFRDLLGVVPLPSPEEIDPLAPAALGQLVHGVLRRVFELLPRGMPASDLTCRAGELLPGAVDRAMAPLLASRLAGLPALGGAVRRACVEAVGAFLAKDLPRLGLLGVTDVQGEITFRASLVPGEPCVEGRLDRVALMADGREELGDYKTGRAPAPRSPAQALRSRDLQLLIYAVAREAAVGRMPEVAHLSVRLPLPREAPRASTITTLTSSGLDAVRTPLVHLLATVLGFAKAGLFPMAAPEDPARGPCRVCDYRAACRTGHAASRARVRGAVPFRAFFELGVEEEEA